VFKVLMELLRYVHEYGTLMVVILLSKKRKRTFETEFLTLINIFPDVHQRGIT
jgi:hypothetical protein